jgi:uncharacterized membrane protein HdeD (DUF308 family)
VNAVGMKFKDRDPTFFGVLTGIIHILGGYVIYQYISYPGSHHIEIGTLMMVFGILTICSYLALWLNKSWTSKAFAGVGIVICVPFIKFSFYFLAALFALIFAARLTTTEPVV